MKKFIVVALLLAGALPLRAESGHGRFYAGLDVFAVGGANTAFEKDASDFVDTLRGTGISATVSGKTNGGAGGRVGIIVPQDNGIEIGGSLGILAGPRIDQHFTNGPFSVNGTNFNSNGTTDLAVRTTYLRALLEGAKKFQIGERSFFRIAVGVGGAAGKTHQTLSTTGSATTLVSALDLKRDTNEDWSGFTWEVSPALVFPFGSTEMEVGIRYAQFPTKKESSNMSKIEWNPLGAFLNLRFGS